MSGGHGHPGIPPIHRTPIVGTPVPVSRAQLIGAQGVMLGPRSPDGRSTIHGQRSIGNHPHFVNIAAATPRPLAPLGLRPTGQIRLAAPEAHQGQPQVQSIQTPPMAHAQGAINLTITNGAVNLRPGGPGLSIRPEARGQGQAVIRANITGPGSLQRIPIMPQNVSQPQAINLKIQNPINLRLTGPQANLIHGGKSGATIIGQRPTMLINAAQLRPIQGQGQIPVMQAVPQSLSGQLIPQGSLTVLPQGTKLSTNIPIHQLANAMQVTGKIPLRAMHHASIKQGSGSGQRSLPTIIQKGSGLTRGNVSSAASGTPVQPATVTVTAIQHGHPIPIQMTQLTPPHSSVAGSQQIILTATNKHLMPSPLTMKTLSTAPNEQLEATDLSTKGTAPAEKKSEPGISTAARPTIIDDQNSKPASSRERLQANGKSQETGPNAKDKRDGPAKESLKEKEEDRENEPFVEDMEASLVWNNGIGMLPGSDLKFRKNEFDMLEMMDDDLQCDEVLDSEDAVPADSHSLTSTPAPESGEAEEKDDGFVSCKNCGIYGPPAEFLPGAQFCSNSCLGRFSSRTNKKRSESGGSAPGSAKKKKRKISEYEADESITIKIPKMKDDGEPGLSGEVTTPSKKDSEGAVNLKSKTTLATGGKRGKSFAWSSYLAKEGGRAAPSSCFKEFQDIPQCKNGFRMGMKMEAIDPRHPSHYCVCTVVEVRGYRLRLRFDGYSESYDFWTNANSPFIFYAGWSEKNGKYLDPPKDYLTKQVAFDWNEYLRLHKATPAPKSYFQTTSTASVTPHGFRTGMKLEAVDKKNSTLICVACIADVLGDHVLIHFDGWEDVYDYWCDPGSPYIHPVGWCQKNGVPLSPPREWKNVESFTWEEYLEQESASAVPARAFKPRQPNSLEEGMHLEVVDKRNPVLIRAASVTQVEAYSIKIHFCGWGDSYDYWLDDDSYEMHPCGWCAKTGHLLTPPLTLRDLAEKNEGCPTPGCTGVGHVKGAKYTGHHSAFGCPYSQFNMNKDNCLLDRLSPGRPEFESGYNKPEKKIKEEVEDIRKSKSPEDRMKRTSPIMFTHSSDVVRNATPAQMEKARELLEQQQKRGVPLFGKGSGRGRKKTIVRLMRELQDLKSKFPLEGSRPALQAQPLGSSEQKGRGLQQGIHQSVFSPAPALHPYHDLPLGWAEHSGKLANSIQGLNAEDVGQWSVERVVEFVTSLPGCDALGNVFEDQQIDGEALLLLNQADMMRSLDMKLGPALKIHNCILLLKNNISV